MGRYKVIVSDRAKTMLGAHIRFASQSSKSGAREAKARLMAAIRSLSDMPERCPFLDVEYVPRDKYHKLYVEKWYLILYQIKGSS